MCNLSGKYTKYVTWSPLTIDMLDVVTGRPQTNTNVECWMDILQGVYPSVKKITAYHFSKIACTLA